jgi:hypothetical protein
MTCLVDRRQENHCDVNVDYYLTTECSSSKLPTVFKLWLYATGVIAVNLL